MEKFKINSVQMIKKEKPFSFERALESPPEVDPKISPKRAVEVLQKFDGGPEIIEMLRKENKKL